MNFFKLLLWFVCLLFNANAFSVIVYIFFLSGKRNIYGGYNQKLNHQQCPFWTQCAIGGMEQPHSTQYISDFILSPTDNFNVPNVHIILSSVVAFTFVWIKFASLRMISSLGSAANGTKQNYYRNESPKIIIINRNSRHRHPIGQQLTFP